MSRPANGSPIIPGAQGVQLPGELQLQAIPCPHGGALYVNGRRLGPLETSESAAIEGGAGRADLPEGALVLYCPPEIAARIFGPLGIRVPGA